MALVEEQHYGRYGAELELLEIGCFKAFEERCRAFARRIYATKVFSRPDSSPRHTRQFRRSILTDLMMMNGY
jgi:hypothetical protein